MSLLFLVLLILGSLAPSDSTRTDTSTTPTPPASGTPVRTIEATMPEDDEVRAQVGDLVNLTVESDDARRRRAAGLRRDPSPWRPSAPALFDILPTQPGTFDVVSTDSGKTIGTLVVEDEA